MGSLYYELIFITLKKLDTPSIDLNGTNTLAYFGAASMTKKKKFNNIKTCSMH
jgi:hypothetical protein